MDCKELAAYLETAEIYDDSYGYGKIIFFDDYSITLMPDNDRNGITVILSKN